MNLNQLDQILQSTFADHRLSQGEKRLIVDWASIHADDEQEKALARSKAFALARQHLSGEAANILDWLEETIKVFSRTAPGTNHPQSKAFFSPGTACMDEILRQFRTAKKSCAVCVFTITDDRITDAIIRAHQRGLNVRVLSDNDKSHDLGSDILELRQAGVPCKMDIGNDAHMHHKYAIFDETILLTGSFNWTRSASHVNEENLLITQDNVLVTAFAQRFEKLWQEMR